MNYEQLVEFLTNKMSMSHREEHGSWLLRTAFCTLHPPQTPAAPVAKNEFIENSAASKERRLDPAPCCLGQSR